jgi:ABC-type Mn2+/Zn2+ transport system permease subunit
MLATVLDPLRDELVRRALLEAVVLALACGPLGAWLVLQQRGYAAESLAHALFPGLAVAAVAGVPLMLGALGGIVVAAALVGLASRQERVGADVAVGVTVTTLFALGALLALRPDAPNRLGDLLFGDLLATSPADLWRTTAIAAAVVVALALVHRRLLLAAFDPPAAPSLGVRPARADLALLLLLALALTATVQALGNLLAVALLLAPAAAALRLTRRLVPAMTLAAGLAVLAALLGIEASYHWSVAAGSSVALASVGLWVLASLLPARLGGRAPAPALRRSPVEDLARAR